MPIINLEDVPEISGTTYSAPYDTPCIARRKKAIGDHGGPVSYTHLTLPTICSV